MKPPVNQLPLRAYTMELRINLRDREEIAAAHAHLAAILGGALVLPALPGVYSVTNRVGDVSQAVTGPSIAALVQAGALPPADNPAIGAATAAEVFGDTSAAAVFGGAAAPNPPAPLGSLPGLPAGSLPSAMAAPVAAPPSYITPEAAAQGLPTAQPGAAPGVTLDKNGLPWDGRIHASTKTTNKDGSWKALRGVSTDLVTQVEAQLRAQLAQGGAAPQPLALAAAPTAATLAPSNVALGLPVASTASADPTTFKDIVTRVVQAVQAKRVPNDTLQQACVAAGLGGVTDLQAAPANVPVVWMTLQAMFPGQV